MPHYAKYVVISRQNTEKIQTEISHQKNVAAEKNLYHSFKYSFSLCNKNFRVIGTLTFVDVFKFCVHN